MRYYIQFFACLFLFMPWQAWAVQVDEVRLWTAPDHTRIVFYLNGYAEYQLGHKKNNIHLDIEHLRLRTDFSHLPIPDSVVASIHYNEGRNDWKRINIRVLEDVTPKIFLIEPSGNKPYRLVLDLMRHAKHHVPDIPTEAQGSGKIIVAVDAGHGGEDPGAIGRNGLQEKKVTLAVAKKLVREINKHPRMHAFLTRKGDYFVPLRKRIVFARKGKADLMISIHADAVASGNARGASVYTLSEKGASDKIAAMLAKKENAADKVGGVMPSDVKDPVVKQILADLIKRASLNSALVLADEILFQVRKVGPIKYKQPKSARFVVLGAAEIPSVLVELDYISHPKGEQLLRRSAHQQKLASALKRATLKFLHDQGRLEDSVAYNKPQQYENEKPSVKPSKVYTLRPRETWQKVVDQPAKHNPLHDALVVKNELRPKITRPKQQVDRQSKDMLGFYTVAHGDTLWNISQRFQTTVSTLRRLNGLKGNNNNIELGQKLRLP